MRWKNERAAQVSAKLDYFIRTRRGFYFQGKKYTGLSFFEDCFACTGSHPRDTVYIRYDNVVDYEYVENERGLLTKQIIVREE